MKIVALADAKNALSAYVDRAQADRVLITRHGKPAAVLVGVEGESLEDLLLSADPAFWRLIEHRRKHSQTVSEEEARAQLGLPPYEPSPRRGAPAAQRTAKPRTTRTKATMATNASQAPRARPQPTKKRRTKPTSKHARG